ncbi:44534_t:CDS:2, partial [Gigaspora margarita]
YGTFRRVPAEIIDEDMEPFEERSSNTIIRAQESVETINAPIVGQTFKSWEELDQYISLYAKSQNFASVIRGSEYNNGFCRSRRYACEHQGHNSAKNKTCILSINFLCLCHNDHQINDQTKKFAVKYRAFSEDMLKDIKFWTEIDLSNAIQTFKRQNYIENEAAVLLNYLLERKNEDTR